MFQSGKSSSAPRNLRLPKQATVPNYNDVQFLMQESHKILSRWVELPFTGHDKGHEFILAVKCESEQDEPAWILTEVATSGANQIVWTHASRDLTLICNLTISAGGADHVQELVPTSFIYGDKATPTVHNQTSSNTVAQHQITFLPPHVGAKTTLEGDLRNLQIPNLLQSINLAKMTGKLDVKTFTETAEVFFVDGIPVHAMLKTISGDAGIVELTSWESGEFRFWPNVTSNKQTITKRLDGLLIEGIKLLDQSKYLTTAGLKPESCLVKKNKSISNEEFAARLSKGAPINMQQQHDVYELIDNRSSLFSLLTKRPMAKATWVPILFNLVTCGLVQISGDVSIENRLSVLKSLGIDDVAVQGAFKNLIRAETGILSYPAFIYLLDQEHLRYEYFDIPFSLVVFSLGQIKNGKVETLQMLAIRQAMQRVSNVKRHIDLLGHHETFDYALLLPNANAAAAAGLTNRIADILRESPLSADMDAHSLVVAFGIASVPEDCQELDKVIALARRARDKAKQTQQRVVIAHELT